MLKIESKDGMVTVEREGTVKEVLRDVILGISGLYQGIKTESPAGAKSFKRVFELLAKNGLLCQDKPVAWVEEAEKDGG